MKSSNNKRLYILLGLASVLLGLLAKMIYRPIIYSNDIYDLGIADSLPSLFYVIGFSFPLFINHVIKPYFIVAIVTLGSISFEFYQFWRTSNFDLSDVIFSILGGLIVTSIYFIKERKIGYNSK